MHDHVATRALTFETRMLQSCSQLPPKGTELYAQNMVP